MRKAKKRILIDMDGVICNFVDTFMTLYRAGGGIVPDDFEWTAWSSMDALPSGNVTLAVWRDPNLFWIQKPYEGAVKAMDALDRHFDVRIVTALPHKHVLYRSDWVKHNLPFIHRKNQMIFTADKSLIQADMIVDDYLPHVYNWLNANKGVGVIIDRPWNQEEPPLANLIGGRPPIRVAELWELAERIGIMWEEDDGKDELIETKEDEAVERGETTDTSAQLGG